MRKNKSCPKYTKHKSEKNLKTRREFIKNISLAAGAAFALSACNVKGDSSGGGGGGTEPEPTVKGPRARRTNPYVTADGKPILVSVSGTDFNRMLAAGMAALGGFARLIGPQENVLIKANLNAAEPYPGISSIDCITGIIEALTQGVTSGNVEVGDVGFDPAPNVYSYMGLEAAAESVGGKAIHFLDVQPVRQPSWEASKPDFLVYKEVYDAPIIINTCCLKRHMRTSMTCSLKCNVGAVSGSDMSGTRDYLHNQAPNLREEVAEIAALVNPELNIVDARTLLTQNGPLYDLGVPVDANRIIICGDMVATDSYCRLLLAQHDSTYDPSKIDDMLQRAVSLGLGTSNLNQVEIIEINA